ncbi:hypothetical protein NFI96_033753 [Prochilodus magdalenae]|nr:hypothetical protein NFI96_033753 [Prochilodus magdalenae]
MYSDSLVSLRTQCLTEAPSSPPRLTCDLMSVPQALQNTTAMMFMKGLLFILASCFISSHAQTTGCKANLADIVFVVDSSSSIGDEDFLKVKTFIHTFIESLDVRPAGIRVGLVQFSTEPHEEFLLGKYANKRDLLEKVDKLIYRTGGTETGKALKFVQDNYFSQAGGSRAGLNVPQIAVVITDGDSNDDMNKPAMELRSKGVLIFTIGVGTNLNTTELQSIASKPHRRFLISFNDYQELLKATASTMDSVCITMEDRQQASVPQSFRIWRVAVVPKFVDVFVLVDSSIQQMDELKRFLESLANQLSVGSRSNRMALAQFSEQVSVGFLFKTYKTKNEVIGYIRNFKLQGTGQRNLGQAMDFVRTQFLNTESGSRIAQGFKQYLLVVSGGKSDDNALSVARVLKAEGVTIVDVDISERVDPRGPSAGIPSVDRPLFTSPRRTFSSTDKTVPQIAQDVKIVIERDRSTRGDCKSAELADIVFIVDVSDAAQNFMLVRSFLYHLINDLEISANGVRVGMILYSDKPTAEFYLNDFDNKNEILQYISILRSKGGKANTGKALKFAREKAFAEELGSRRARGVPQIAVVITEGYSDDEVLFESAELRRFGVKVYAAGMAKDNMEQLKNIASYPPRRFVIPLNSFDLSKTLCNNVVRSTIADKNRFNLQQGCRQTEEADIYFLIDDSGSITNPDFDDMKKFILEFLQLFKIGPNKVRLGLVKYATKPTVEFDLNKFDNRDSIEKAVPKILHKGGGTFTGDALTYMGDLFRKAKEEREKVRQILIVITDGKSNDSVTLPAAALRGKGVSIYAIGVKTANESELLDMAHDPNKMFFVTNYDALRPLKNEILTDICSDDACKDMQADIIFLVDGSRSIRTEDFSKMKKFIKTMISKVRIGRNSVQIGLVQFSTASQTEFTLNRYYDERQLEQAVDAIRQMDQNTLIGSALNYVSPYFEPLYGGRPQVPRFLIVITDGESQDDVNVPAKNLREKGVTIYSIGVEDANVVQLRNISGSPTNVYMERDFDALNFLDKDLLLKICNSADGESYLPCLFLFCFSECQKTQVADVVFLVDGSSSIAPKDFESMKVFMNSMVSGTEVGQDNVRFCSIVYSDAPEAKFPLNRYNSKREVQQAISGILSPGGNTYTAKALQYSLAYFDKANGGRAENGIPQMMFVITDGEATDPHDLSKAADALHNRGVSVYGIGVAQAKRSELEIITKDSKKVFEVTDFEALKALRQNISSVLCKESKPECQKSVADLVILIDGSESINKQNWEKMIQFMLNLIDSLRIREDLFRIGVAQFSSKYKKEFYLNEKKTAKDMKDSIKAIKQLKEGTEIGHALDQVREFFDTSKGSRINSGISQNLLLITDGQSNDKVENAADVLRAMSVEMLAVGIGDVSQDQLNYIAREKVFLLDTFDVLKLNITIQNLIDKICTITPSEQKGCTVDIGVGFDVSRISASQQSLFTGQYKLQVYLPEIIRQISTLHNLCCLTKPTLQTKTGFRLVARNGNVLYDTGFETYSEDVMQKIMAQQISQPLALNSQLLRSFQDKLKASNAGVKVRESIFIISSLESCSADSCGMLIQHFANVTGVHALLMVALEGVQSTTELQKLEFGRGLVYKEPLTVSMQSVASAIHKQIDSVTSRECCNVMCKCSGHEGMRGPRGPPGSKGSAGRRGHPGYPGEEGGMGSRGYRGDMGEAGEDGLDGVNGEQGVTGSAGTPGERGDQGRPVNTSVFCDLGSRGIPGVPGVNGEKGLRGDPGRPGGNNNIPGPKGDPGNPGPQGVIGQDGIKGALGDSGKDGARGPPGTPGLPGVIGASGPSGKIGDIGVPGEKGTIGLPGPQGPPGTQGGLGSKGTTGHRGQKGQIGDPGDKGTIGQVGSRGTAGTDGRDGYGIAGPKGSKGEIGDSGTPGGNGPKGNWGRGGNAGRSGPPGDPGSDGFPGHRGLKGPPGIREKDTCDLITYVRNNCDNSACPVYPTELVIGLDMSSGVTEIQFERMRAILLSLIDSINIAESNCPSGARVAVVSYSTNTKYLIRFSDHHRKTDLIEAVRNIALERTSSPRDIGTAMRFVGRNVFKRVRQGVLMRKVAIFLTAGDSQELTSMTTAVLEYKASDIKLGVIAFRPAPTVRRAFEADEKRSFILVVTERPRDQSAAVQRIQQCILCFDPCSRAPGCPSGNEELVPEEVDLDLAMLVDGSRSMQGDEYDGVKQVLGTVLDQLVVSRQPNRNDRQARVALYQQSSTYSEVQAPVREIFSFQQYQDRNQMKQSIFQRLQQTGGFSRLGYAMEFAVEKGLLTVSMPRKNKMLLVIVGGETDYYDIARLDYVTTLMKCEGIVTFVVTVGNHFNNTQVEALASFPIDQHIIHLGHVKQQEQDYAQRFVRTFLHILSRSMNIYAASAYKSLCENFQRGQYNGQVYVEVPGTAKKPYPDRTPLATPYPEEEVEEEEEEVPTEEYPEYAEGTHEVISYEKGTPISTHGDLKAQCLLHKDSGTLCGDFVQRWYYDSAVGACSLFWYGGCDGNSNRFRTENECSKTCMTYSKSLQYHVCSLDKDQGPCRAFLLKWFYDTQQNECTRFWYGGCDGNANRFDSQEECEARCCYIFLMSNGSKHGSVGVLGNTAAMEFIKTLLILASCFLTSGAGLFSVPVCTEEAVADIVFLVDGSWSIGKQNFQRIREFLLTLVDSFDVGPDKVHIGLAQYTNSPRTEFYLNSYKSKQEIQNYISNLPYMGGGTRTGLGLQFLLKDHFKEESGSRANTGAPQIAVVITDGKSQDDVEPHAQELKQRGIILYAIGIKDIDMKELKEIASMPHDQHIYNVSDFTALQGISQSFINVLCTQAEEAKRQVSQVQLGCKANLADVVFILDGSSSIGDADFEKAKRFLYTFIEALNVKPAGIRVGLVQFADNPYKEFLLGEYTNKNDLLEKVNKLIYRTGGTATGKALRFVQDNYFSQVRATRVQNVPQIAVVITDGDSSDDMKTPAMELRSKGVLIFTIGVGAANVAELQSIASRPYRRFLISFRNYQELLAEMSSTMDSVCITMEDQQQGNAEHIVTTLAPKFVDMFVLVDSSVQMDEIQKFLVGLANQLNVGSQSSRMALAQFGKEVSVEFSFNAYKTKNEVIALIRKFQLRGDGQRNTGQAMDFVRTRFLNTESGSRIAQGIKQYLLVVSAGQSDDNVHRAARTIKADGVSVINVDMSNRASDPASPPTLFSSPGKTIFTADATAIQKMIQPTGVPAVTAVCKSVELADIVFIVDVSDTAQRNIHLVRHFLYRLIYGLRISAKGVRVGIVLYSETPEAKFHLNESDNKNEILQYINILRYKGGKTHTGKALKFARETVFTTNHGSRRAQRVPQIAVVITAGKSQDDVSSEAAKLRRSGVYVYAVGMRKEKKQLEEIASHPPRQFLFAVDSFVKLDQMARSLGINLCNNIGRLKFENKYNLKAGCRQTEEADIYFLIDDSGSITHPDFQDMKHFTLDVTQMFQIGPDHVRVGLMKYESSPKLQFTLEEHNDRASFEKAVQNIVHEGGGTETGKALRSMRGLFKKAKETRTNVNQILIVITDGQSDDSVKEPAEALRNDGVSIYAIGVREAKEQELLDMAGDKLKYFSITNYDTLRLQKDYIIKAICSEEACKYLMADIIFLVDSLESNTKEEFEKVKSFLNNTVSYYYTGKSRVRFGLVHTSAEFSLDTYKDPSRIIKIINGMYQINKVFRIDNALRDLSQEFDPPKARSIAPKFLFLITHRQFKYDLSGYAKDLRDKGVTIYSIGVDEANITQLRSISGNHNNAYMEKDLNALDLLAKELLAKLCNAAIACKKSQVADVVFLAEGSSNIGPNDFDNMKDFMNSVVQTSQVGQNNVRFCSIVYSDAPEAKFSLNQYKNKLMVQQAISDMSAPGGNTYTGKALQYSLAYFDKANGGRADKGIPQMMFVITRTRTRDYYQLQRYADALQNRGVSVYGIAVTEATKGELEIITKDSEKVFQVDNFEALSSLQQNISSVVCKECKPECLKEAADLVFLIDASESIYLKDWIATKNFMLKVIENLRIREDLFRIGVAQFSTDYTKVFYLNRYNNVADLNVAIQNIERQRGDTHIGLALEKVQEFFEASKGSRIQSGISQNLILITDGTSTDLIGDTPERLRDKKIEIFSIGVGGEVSQDQLIYIAGSPERTLIIDSYESLNLMTTALKVIDIICRSNPIPSSDMFHLRFLTDCTVDIGVGFDVSRITSSPQSLFTFQLQLKTYLPEIIRQMSTLYDLCCLTKPTLQTKMGFRLVAMNGNVLYDTDFEAYSEEMIKKIMALQSSQSLALNTQLLRSFGDKLKASKAKVKVVIIFSDGLDEPVYVLKRASEDLRNNGSGTTLFFKLPSQKRFVNNCTEKNNGLNEICVHALLMVALEGFPSPEVLRQVEFGRGFDYKDALTIGMQSVASVIHKQIDTVTLRVCCNVWCKCTGPQGERGDHGESGSPVMCHLIPDRKAILDRRGILEFLERKEELFSSLCVQGTTGPAGSKGGRGNTGTPGLRGITGSPGMPGPTGLRGDPGLPGSDSNIRGPKGEIGNPGLQGDRGQYGNPGTPGGPGNPGQKGRQGNGGLPGPTGPPGALGLQGTPGATGTLGPAGPNGVPGQRGTSGLPGPQGAAGTPGGLGSKGNIGTRGLKGELGDPGDKGATGTTGNKGFPGTDGPDGSGIPGTKGQRGNAGKPGIPGASGIRGVPGREGTDLKPVIPRPYTFVYVLANSEHFSLLFSYGVTTTLANGACPVYPTELVIGLDMSSGVTDVQFERMRAILLSLIDAINITDSNCPSGARVAVVSYSSTTKYLIRFSDHHRKTDLIEAVRNIALERTSNQRNIGAAMRFVGRNVFKRVRQGVLIRKVAIFLTDGPSQDVTSITTAALEYKASDIALGVIAFRAVPNVRRIFEADSTGRIMLVVVERLRDQSEEVNKILKCTLCLDPCHRPIECFRPASALKELDLDLALLVDGSRSIMEDEYEGVKQVLGTVLDQLPVSRQPNRDDRQARVALYQQSSTYSETQAPVKEIFSFLQYQDRNQLRENVYQNLQQSSGFSRLGHAVEFIIMNSFVRVPRPRKNKMLLVTVGENSEYIDREKLDFISKMAKCKGIVVFVLSVGNHFNISQVEELASLPVDQHIVHLSHVKDREQEYAEEFLKAFFNTLSSGIQPLIPPSLRRLCQGLDGSEERGPSYTDAFETAEKPPIERVPLPTTAYPEDVDKKEEEVVVKEEETVSVSVSHTVNPEDTATEEEVSYGNRTLFTPGRGDTYDVCHLNKEQGSCSTYTLKWFHDKEKNECARFWYGGCDGNANRFDTQEECVARCMMQ